MAKEKVVIVSGARTPIGSFLGTLKDVSLVELSRIVIEDVIKRAGVKPELVDEVIFGNVVGVGRDSGLACRGGANQAGIPYESSAYTLNRACSSGLQSIYTAAMQIRDGFSEVVVAGGFESMSRIPYALYNQRTGYRMGNGVVSDLLTEGLYDAYANVSMGMTAENVAEKFGITRENADRYAAQSHARAAKAIADGKFKDEIVPVVIKTRKGEVVFDTDEGPKVQTTVEVLSKLRPVFKPDGGVVTAGNASSMNDGAAAVLVMSEKKAKDLGLKPIVEVVDAAVVGVDPHIMGIGPVPAIQKLLKKTGLKLDDVGVYEINEAFATQALACVKELGLSEDKVNVNGSGISIGHPLGATGAMLAVKIMNEMVRENHKYGIASLCIGTGQGLAVLFKKC